MNKKLVCLIVVVIFTLGMLGGCTGPEGDTPSASSGNSASVDKAADGITIGVSVGDLRLERWKRDLDYMVESAENLGATVFSNSADGDAVKQNSQIEDMITKGVDVMIIIPLDSNSLSPAVEECHKAGVKVVAYDRIINNCDLDYYITYSFDKIGRAMAQFLVDRVPTGNYYLQHGPKEDTNQKLFTEAQMKVLQPLIDKGDIKIVGEQFADDYLPENAMKQTEQVLTANDNKIDAILAQNDSTCLGAIQALQEQGLAGKIPITGCDADLANCQAIVDGTMSMTIYKRLSDVAEGAVQLAYSVATDDAPDLTDSYNNGQKDVPSINIEFYITTKENMMDTVVKDGFHSYAEVYANVPEDQRPPNPNNY
jgi:D-xylose transport system substrate-binding protein